MTFSCTNCGRNINVRIDEGGGCESKKCECGMKLEVNLDVYWDDSAIDEDEDEEGSNE